MTGTPTYTPIEITFVLTAIVQNTRHTLISEDFEAKFGRKLGANQIRYIKNKYGKDPRYNSVMINCRGARGARLGVRAIVPRSAKQHQRAQAEARASQRAYLLATMPGSIVTMPGAMTGSMDAQVSLPDFDTAMINPEVHMAFTPSPESQSPSSSNGYPVPQQQQQGYNPLQNQGYPLPQPQQHGYQGAFATNGYYDGNFPYGQYPYQQPYAAYPAQAFPTVPGYMPYGAASFSQQPTGSAPFSQPSGGNIPSAPFSSAPDDSFAGQISPSFQAGGRAVLDGGTGSGAGVGGSAMSGSGMGGSGTNGAGGRPGMPLVVNGTISPASRARLARERSIGLGITQQNQQAQQAAQQAQQAQQAQAQAQAQQFPGDFSRAMARTNDLADIVRSVDPHGEFGSGIDTSGHVAPTDFSLLPMPAMGMTGANSRSNGAPPMSAMTTTNSTGTNGFNGASSTNSSRGSNRVSPLSANGTGSSSSSSRSIRRRVNGVPAMVQGSSHSRNSGRMSRSERRGRARRERSTTAFDAMAYCPAGRDTSNGTSGTGDFLNDNASGDFLASLWSPDTVNGDGAFNETLTSNGDSMLSGQGVANGTLTSNDNVVHSDGVNSNGIHGTLTTNGNVDSDGTNGSGANGDSTHGQGVNGQDANGSDANGTFNGNGVNGNQDTFNDAGANGNETFNGNGSSGSDEFFSGSDGTLNGDEPFDWLSDENLSADDFAELARIGHADTTGDTTTDFGPFGPIADAGPAPAGAGSGTTTVLNTPRLDVDPADVPLPDFDDGMALADVDMSVDAIWSDGTVNGDANGDVNGTDNGNGTETEGPNGHNGPNGTGPNGPNGPNGTGPNGPNGPGSM